MVAKDGDRSLWRFRVALDDGGNGFTLNFKGNEDISPFATAELSPGALLVLQEEINSDARGVSRKVVGEGDLTQINGIDPVTTIDCFVIQAENKIIIPCLAIETVTEIATKAIGITAIGDKEIVPVTAVDNIASRIERCCVAIVFGCVTFDQGIYE